MRDPGAAANLFSGVLPARFKVERGDLLLSWSATLMALIWDRQPAWLNQHIFKVIPRSSVHRSYLHHLLGAALEKLASQSHGTTMRHVKRSDLLPFQVWVAPTSEQPGIAEILDTLDSTIRSTERLIAKLEQIQQGLLHDLLTRGIDDNGELRDPIRHPGQFIDTPIGPLPRSWSLSNVNAEFDVRAGITLGPGREPGRNASPYLRVANVYRRRLALDDVICLQASAAERAEYSLRVDDLLVVEGHANPREIGRCAIVSESAAGFLYQNHLFRLRAKSMVPGFSELWLNSQITRSYWYRICSSSSGLNTINSKQLKAVPVAIPTRAEQADILRRCEGSSGDVRAESAALDKLRSLNAGLMEDLLTGRVRVNLAEDAA